MDNYYEFDAEDEEYDKKTCYGWIDGAGKAVEASPRQQIETPREATPAAEINWNLGQNSSTGDTVRITRAELQARKADHDANVARIAELEAQVRTKQGSGNAPGIEKIEKLTPRDGLPAANGGERGACCTGPGDAGCAVM